MNDTASFLFVRGTSGNVGVGMTVPIGQLDVQAGSGAPPKILNINGTFTDLTSMKTGLYIDVTTSVAGASVATGSWSEIRTVPIGDAYNSA